MEPLKENEIKDLAKISQVLKPASYKPIKSSRYVGAPTLGSKYIDEDFNMVYSCIFVMNS